MIYADTSALVKLVVTESETEALRRWLGHPDHVDEPVATNQMGVVELQRVGAIVGPEALSVARHIITTLDVLAMTEQAWTLAATLPPPRVRTLDALHIASAATTPTVSGVVSYDERMIDAARGYGLTVHTPQ